MSLLLQTDICFYKLTCIFHKPLFMPYLPQVGGDHLCSGIWFRWMGLFHCPVSPSSFPHLLPFSLCILPPPPSLSPLPTLRPPCRAKSMRPSIHAWPTLPVLIEHIRIHTCLSALFVGCKHCAGLDKAEGVYSTGTVLEESPIKNNTNSWCMLFNRSVIFVS